MAEPLAVPAADWSDLVIEGAEAEEVTTLWPWRTEVAPGESESENILTLRIFFLAVHHDDDEDDYTLGSRQNIIHPEPWIVIGPTIESSTLIGLSTTDRI